MLDSYFKLVNRISRSFDHNFGTPRAKERKKWIHTGFMFTTLGLICFSYYMYSFVSHSYLDCINQAHQDCNNIKTQCHIVKYNKTISVDRHNSDIRLNVGDLVKKDMIVTYFDVYSNQYPDHKYVADTTYLVESGIIDNSHPTFECYHENKNTSPQPTCDFTNICMTLDILLSGYIAIGCIPIILYIYTNISGIGMLF